MIQITFGCSHIYTTNAPASMQMRNLVQEAKSAGIPTHAIYQALRANKMRHSNRCINLSEVRLALGLRS